MPPRGSNACCGGSNADSFTGSGGLCVAALGCLGCRMGRGGPRVAEWRPATRVNEMQDGDSQQIWGEARALVGTAYSTSDGG